MTDQTVLAGQLHAGHIGMTLRGIDARGHEVHAELRQVYHTSSETIIDTNPLDFDTLRDGCGAMGEWALDAHERVSLDGPPDLHLNAPPNTLTLGSVWENADALEAACVRARRDQVTVIDCGGNVNVWDGHRGWWEGSAPLRYAPFTILHAGTKANQ